jgi:hypothetical protein
VKVGAFDILGCLEKRYAGNGYVCVRELRPSVGYKGEERLKQPMKRRAAMAISNYFWIAAPKGVVKPEELPPDCGLIEFKSEVWEPWYQGEIVIPANYRDKIRCSWGLMASVLRKVRNENL